MAIRKKNIKIYILSLFFFFLFISSSYIDQWPYLSYIISNCTSILPLIVCDSFVKAKALGSLTYSGARPWYLCTFCMKISIPFFRLILLMRKQVWHFFFNLEVRISIKFFI